MLASGAHIKIGSVEYQLDEEKDRHYVHAFTPRQLDATQIVGSEGKVSFKEGKILWTWDDWSGGEGNKIYYPDEPTKYDSSDTLNPRKRGQLTGRPSRNRQVFTSNAAARRTLFGVGDSALWMARSHNGAANYEPVLQYTTDCVTWTTRICTTITYAGGGHWVSAMTGDETWLYYAEGINGQRVIRRRTTAVADDTVSTATEAATVNPYCGLAVFNSNLYAWDGIGLYRIGTSTAAFVGGTPERISPLLGVPSTVVDPFAAGAAFGEMVVADTELVMFYSTHGLSKVYSFHLERGFSEIWTAPIGFSIKSICYLNGYIYCVGHWGGVDDTSIQGFGAMYAISLDNRQASFVKWFRQGHPGEGNLLSSICVPSFGNQVLIASSYDGRIFVYDADLNSLSMLDDLDTSRFGVSNNKTDALTYVTGTERIGGLATFNNKRLASIFLPGAAGSGNNQIVDYSDDEPASRQASTSTGDVNMPQYSGEFDLGFPYEGKLVHGVHVAYNVDDATTTSGLDDGQSIVVEGSFDDAAYVTLATITSASTPSSGIKGRTFVSDLANNRKFYKCKLKVTLKGIRTAAVNYTPPILKNVTLETSLDDYEETWDLIVRVQDESNDSGLTPRTWHAFTLRDNLEDLAQNKNSVTFLDGTRYPEPGRYTTHTVTVEGPEDVIERNAEGYMHVRLRAVSF